MRRFLAKLAAMLRGRSTETDLSREIDSHLGMLARGFRAARAAARRSEAGRTPGLWRGLSRRRNYIAKNGR